jgi:hypothetical protein
MPENRFSRTAVSSSATISWSSPATANAAANVSTSGGPRLFARREFHQFWHFRPQRFEIGGFRFRIINRLFGKHGRQRIALEYFDLLLDRSRKACSCIYEHVQCCARDCQRNQAEERVPEA